MNENLEGNTMNKTLGSLGLALLLALPVQALGQEQSEGEECQLQPSAEATAAQQFLGQAGEDAELSEDERRQLYEQAWEQLEGAIEAGSDDGTIHVLGAQAQLGLGNYDRAGELLDRFEELRPECSDFAERVRYSEWARVYNRAIEAYQGGDTDQALTHFVRASNVYKDARSLVNAATLFRQKGQLDTAAVLYEEVLDSGGEPEQIRDAVTSLARIRGEQGNPEEALSVFRDYMAEHPDDVLVRLNYAQTLSDAGQTDSAQVIFEEMLNRPDLDFAQWSQLGIGLYRAGNYEDAAKAFRSAREIDPLNKESMENLGSSLVQAKQFEEAMGVADTLATWYPYDNQNLSLAVRAFSQAGDSQRAQALLNQMKAMPIKFHQLGMASPGQGQYAMQGIVENATMDRSSATVTFELLDETGNVVDTKDLEIDLPAQGERRQFQVQFQAEPGAATFRYEEL